MSLSTFIMQVASLMHDISKAFLVSLGATATRAMPPEGRVVLNVYGSALTNPCDGTTYKPIGTVAPPPRQKMIGSPFNVNYLLPTPQIRKRLNGYLCRAKAFGLPILK